MTSLKNSAERSSLLLDRLEPARLFRERTFRGQTLHRAGAVKAMAALRVPEDKLGILRLGDRTAMDKYDDIAPDPQRRLRPLVDERRALIESQRSRSADIAACREAQMADDDVGSRLGHRFGLLA